MKPRCIFCKEQTYVPCYTSTYRNCGCYKNLKERLKEYDSKVDKETPVYDRT